MKLQCPRSCPTQYSRVIKSRILIFYSEAESPQRLAVESKDIVKHQEKRYYPHQHHLYPLHFLAKNFLLPISISLPALSLLEASEPSS